MENQKFIEIVKEGFLPGPFEKEEDFFKRVTYCKGLKNTLGFDEVPPSILPKPLALTRKLFGIEPYWIPINFSNHQLPLWVGGCAWIFQNTKETPTGAFIQLRQSLKDYSSLYLYKREELISHELSHVGRMLFEEPKYEEIFAYKTSPNRFRRFLGPIFSQGWEMLCFSILVMFVFMADICALWWGGWESYLALLPLKLLPLAWFSWMLWKLTLKQLRINKLEKRYPLKFLYGLTDLEIDSFVKMTDQQVKEYARQQACLRWKYLRPYLGG